MQGHNSIVILNIWYIITRYVFVYIQHTFTQILYSSNRFNRHIICYSSIFIKKHFLYIIFIRLCFNSVFIYCSVCEDEEFKRDDRHCWNGDRVSEYTQTVMSTGVDAQRYNPEVPLEAPTTYTKPNKLNELVDKLIKLRHTVANAVSILVFSLVFNWVYIHNKDNWWQRLLFYLFTHKL